MLVVPLVKITALTVAKAFCTHWVFPYSPPAELISDNGARFQAKLFQAVCLHLRIKNKFTTAQAKGQVERSNRTLLAGFRAFAADHPRHWLEYADALAYAYITQVSRMTGQIPFDLVISRSPVHVALERKMAPATSPNSSGKGALFEAFRTLVASTTPKLLAAQRRYKADHDRRLGSLDLIFFLSEKARAERRSIGAANSKEPNHATQRWECRSDYT